MKKEEEFNWVEGTCAPLGYPIEVYMGGLESNAGGFASLADEGVITSPWGESGGGMSNGIKPLPDSLDAIWVSYAENTFYRVTCAIDHEKILKLFKEGYVAKDLGNKQRQFTYDIIIVGFAPGGVVVVWVAGAGRRVEIGRYQGQKTVVPEREIAGLDSHRRLIFDASYRAKVMMNEKIVPKEIQEAHKNKPIPTGLWDSYREKYFWRPVFVQHDSAKMRDINLFMFNGEYDKLFHKSLDDNEFIKRAVPKKINFGWVDSTGQSYGGYITFDEAEIFDAYKELFKNNKEGKAELELRANMLHTYVMVTLKGNGKEIPLKHNTVDVFKSRVKYN